MSVDLVNNCGSWPARWAERRPEALAVVDDARRLDWRGFEQRVAHLTGWLERDGIVRGDRVALWLPNASAYLELVFACARLGAIAVPLNTRSTRRELAFMLGDAEPSALFHAPVAGAADEVCAADVASRAAPGCRTVEVGGNDDAYEAGLVDAHARHAAVPVDAADPMILMYTSGTTGAPKGALLPHRKTFTNCANALLYFGIRADDRVLVPAPLFHSLALQILSLPASYAGAAVFLHPRFDPAAAWTTIVDERITYTGGVPTMYQRLHEWFEREGIAREDVPETLRFLFTAGAAISVELVRAFEARGMCLKQGYGQTETSTLTCLSEEDALRKAGSVGRPVFHAELQLVDPERAARPVSDWKTVADGETGEIVVRGPLTMTGYWRQPEASREVLREEGWLRTGDLATRDAEGFITLVGRSRDMFISGGENVYPAELEAALLEHPDVAEAAVVGVPDPAWGEAGRAYVVPRTGVALDTPALRVWLEERLARFKIPREFVAVAGLPRTASGKVQKHRLADLEAVP